MGLKTTLLLYKQALRLPHDVLMLLKYMQLNIHLARINNCTLHSGNTWNDIVLLQQYYENVCNLLLLVKVLLYFSLKIEHLILLKLIAAISG